MKNFYQAKKEELYNKKLFTNQTYNEMENRFEGGQVFKKLYAQTRFDNRPSYALLEKLGFRHQRDDGNVIKMTYKDKNFKYDFELNFDDSNMIYGETWGSIE